MQFYIAKGMEELTWEVQTLLNVTKAIVCTNIANAKSFAPYTNPSPIDKPNCGMKAARGFRMKEVHNEVLGEER